MKNESFTSVGEVDLGMELVKLSNNNYNFKIKLFVFVRK